MIRERFCSNNTPTVDFLKTITSQFLSQFFFACRLLLLCLVIVCSLSIPLVPWEGWLCFKTGFFPGQLHLYFWCFTQATSYKGSLNEMIILFFFCWFLYFFIFLFFFFWLGGGVDLGLGVGLVIWRGVAVEGEGGGCWYQIHFYLFIT